MTFEMLEVKADRSTKTNRRVDNLVEDFDTLLSVMDRASRQKASKYLENFNIINQLNLIDIYKTLYSTTAEHTFSSSSQNICQDRQYSG